MNHNRSLTKVVVCFSAVLITLCALAFASPDKKDKSVGRLLYGKVLDMQDNPLPDAVVYVTNTRTRGIKTYIVGRDGSYRFPALATGVDYQVYAQTGNDKKSDTKSVSQFDDRPQVYLDLKIDIH
ncbi:MAG TPA: carboxypeptidase-like regulatory domain-containing protein [Candidatus Sulfotelmatobacter sp.]|nr:carboxypeptidase-like regulatory domain-containing protein [Candidatus Sulfotelmatobacter sp.]